MYKEITKIPFNRFQTLIRTESGEQFSPILGGNCIEINRYIREKIAETGIPSYAIGPEKGYHTGIIIGEEKRFFYSQTDGMVEPVDISLVTLGEPYEYQIEAVSSQKNRQITFLLSNWETLSLYQTLFNSKNKPVQDLDARNFDLSEITSEHPPLPIEYIRSKDYKLRLSIIHRNERLVLGLNENQELYIKCKDKIHLQGTVKFTKLFNLIATKLKLTASELLKMLKLAQEIQQS